uniref:Uncharacterized protein n=1 Tax=Eutreptiella gymnastica TaxID=73025 RepID=A0A7S1NL69_9EUGL|mmetsp:Transcript_53421/g.95279  ORF Transcript_53421/g.95279 Transcript_53421/m.95279 type:complete len:123 (+) Transcript_53421:153-521(+)
MQAAHQNVTKAVQKRDSAPCVSTTREMNHFSKALALTADVLRQFDALRDKTVAEAVKLDRKEQRKRGREEANSDAKQIAGKGDRSTLAYLEHLMADSFPQGKGLALKWWKWSKLRQKTDSAP